VALVLTIDSARWADHVARTASQVSGLIPVVKGNGYGLGRDWLAHKAAELSSLLAVGTVHEVASVPAGRTAVVLTPSLGPCPGAVVTIGSAAHLEALGSTGHRVLVKIRSSMGRYGADPAQARQLLATARGAGHEVLGVSIHPPLVGSSADHAAEIATLLDTIEPVGVWVSHLDTSDYDELRRRFADRQWWLRLGTRLWHGDKSMMNLRADVIDTRTVEAGEIAGYHGSTIPVDGTLVMVGCGSAHGVAPLADGRSPFHFARQRMDLLEAPHMHTSMCVVPKGQPAPTVGEWVDVQRPLTTTNPDLIDWV
jgi:alanine racemase